MFSEYDLIFKKAQIQKPDLFDLTILGSVLHSFYNCFNLIDVSIPNTVTSIGNNAFDHCSGLTTIELGSSLKFKDFDDFDSFMSDSSSVFVL